MELEPGTKVHYDNGFGEPTNGIVKSKSMDSNFVFVVYHCGGDWENYENYTAASTRIENLKIGWITETTSLPT